MKRIIPFILLIYVLFLSANSCKNKEQGTSEPLVQAPPLKT